ncbi:hypothetical protein F0L74_13195 [Chitinophaga agrisoli]|uniref:Tetratricopeptide repeat protein n=1 Tax=Chitinophaga agrisoli TaxID=2607653 RepID=A0A5B2VWJ2_9BACT|nr:hypothetical protein [Chitinophaga agrisoli]KAA2243445.1 hypothetical protein F0L74_13195 [Chitinophaga agrisoli]
MTANRIIQHIFQQPALPQVTEAALEELVSDYPYFTAARLLLAQKNYDRFPNLYAPAIKKAQLYSSNQHYFYQFVTGDLEKRTAAPVAAAGNQPFTVPSYSEPEATAPTAATSGNWWDQPVEEAAPEVKEPEVSASSTNGNWWEQPTQEPELETSTPTAATTGNWWDQPAQEPEPEVSKPAATTSGNWWEQPTQEPEPAEKAPEAPPSTTGGNWWEQPAPVDNETVTTTAITNDTLNVPPAATTTVAGETAASRSEQAEEPIRIFPLEIPEEETTLTFQPLYSDDYFAYKRLKEPEQADELNEKGMAEMRSFTDWLREMKTGFAQKANRDWYHQQLQRIYEDEAPEVSEAVEKAAMESITLNDDIVSETLAEIWARQRQYQTAIQIYQKLSLLNPNKSAYFAQKIQELQAHAVQSETGKI